MSPTTTTIRNRLNIDDLLDIAGKEQIKGYRWADGLCAAMNPYLSVDHRLSLTSTGDDVYEVMKSLPPSIQIRLSRILIDVETGEVSTLRHTSGSFPALPDDIDEQEEEEEDGHDRHGEDTQHHQRDQSPQNYERYEDDQDRPARRQREPKSNAPPNSTIMMMIAMVLVVIALIMTFTVSKIAQETGKPMESSTLEVVLKVLGDVFTSSANTNPDTRGKSEKSGSDYDDSGSGYEDGSSRYDDSSDDAASPDYSQ